MLGKTVSPSVYRHEQSVASADWVIHHSLGGNGSKGVPIVDVFIDINSQLTKVNPVEIKYTDANTVTVTHSRPKTGIAIILA